MVPIRSGLPRPVRSQRAVEPAPQLGLGLPLAAVAQVAPGQLDQHPAGRVLGHDRGRPDDLPQPSVVARGGSEYRGVGAGPGRARTRVDGRRGCAPPRSAALLPSLNQHLPPDLPHDQASVLPEELRPGRNLHTEGDTS